MRSKVLIVDVNEINLLVAERMVAALGCKTVCALTGREAVALHRQERPDLVLIDLSMPDMDGFEAASEIMRLQDGDAVKAPIVAMTAHPALTHRNRCLDAGFSGFLEKPATFDKVEKTLSPFLAPGSTPHSDPTGDKP